MINKQFYSWRVIYPSGEIYYRKGIKLKDLKAPFRFELIPLEKHLLNFYADIKEGEELIYYRRVKGHFGTFSGVNVVDWIKYCIGKRVGSHISVLWIDAETGRLQIQNGENITLEK